MDFTALYASTAPSYAQVSPGGEWIASFSRAGHILIRSTRSLELAFVFQVDEAFAKACQWIQWKPLNKDDDEEQEETSFLFVASSEKIIVINLLEPEFYAIIQCAHDHVSRVQWTRTKQILLFSDLHCRLTVWSVVQKKGLLLQQVKSQVRKGFAFHPTLPFAVVLHRKNGFDFAHLYQMSTENWKLSARWKIPTIDAQSIHWSPDGSRIAVVEAAFENSVYVYTSLGNYITKICPPSNQQELGLCNLQWAPDGSYVLAHSLHNSSLRCLEPLAFSNALEFVHSYYPDLDAPTHVWQEDINYQDQSKYKRLDKPPFIQKSYNATIRCKMNVDGTLLASCCNSVPNILWIWSVSSRSLHTMLVQSAPIIQWDWHLYRSDLLVIRCAVHPSRSLDQASLLFFWSAAWAEPRIIRVPKMGFIIRHHQWMKAAPSNGGREAIVVCGNSSYTIGYVVESEDDSETTMMPTMTFSDFALSDEPLASELDATKTITIQM
ncbi:WDR8 family WD repeat protein [Schizosaccharomyces japonicus yFS275]|uniref:WDR8 family WD repeat protein n=1 Tax=Schizosaccharomyces japonicus (strain yFS275 / FY16936) TaxID=402676 RepID=B6K379_SCHJY|nr:WDR8 family WD repeat protein [Schizosaccharomyces japonicus yFS275]EEB07936.1 WDR8 family WD repeat protein [Schizosaccharomyces japonicus yFS275]